MTIKEFLQTRNVDIDSNKSLLGNQLKGDLALAGVSIDFNKNIKEIEEEDLYQLGRILILSSFPGKAYFKDEIIEIMRIDIAEFNTDNL